MCHMMGGEKRIAGGSGERERELSDKLRLYHIGLISVKANFARGGCSVACEDRQQVTSVQWEQTSTQTNCPKVQSPQHTAPKVT